MRQSSARNLALAALQRWRKQKNRADAIISKFLAETTLSAADRAFALELFYGVLRNLSVLDFWIARLRNSRFEVLLGDIVRLGLYQLFFLGTPEHAAVNETVELAPKRGRSLVNAILRSAVRQRKHCANGTTGLRRSMPESMN